MAGVQTKATKGVLKQSARHTSLMEQDWKTQGSVLFTLSNGGFHDRINISYEIIPQIQAPQ